MDVCQGQRLQGEVRVASLEERQATQGPASGTNRRREIWVPGHSVPTERGGEQKNGGMAGATAPLGPVGATTHREAGLRLPLPDRQEEGGRGQEGGPEPQQRRCNDLWGEGRGVPGQAPDPVLAPTRLPGSSHQVSHLTVAKDPPSRGANATGRGGGTWGAPAAAAATSRSSGAAKFPAEGRRWGPARRGGGTLNWCFARPSEVCGGAFVPALEMGPEGG